MSGACGELSWCIANPIILGVDAPFFSTIVLSKAGRLPSVSGGFLEASLERMEIPFSQGARRINSA